MDWNGGFKNRIHLAYYAYKKHISPSTIDTIHSIRLENSSLRKQNWETGGVVILISNKTDFKSKLVRRNKEDHYNKPRGYYISKYGHTKYTCTQFYKINTTT